MEIYSIKQYDKKLNFIIKILIIIIIIIFIIINIFFLIQKKINIKKYIYRENNLKFNILYTNKNINLKNYFEYFQIIDIKYLFSFKYNIIKIEYKIGLFDKNKNLILPSDFKLYKNMQLFCFIEILKNNVIINSLPNIFMNNYFTCVEFFNINEKINIGIKLYEFNEKEQNIEKYKLSLFNEKAFDIKNYVYKSNNIFDPLILIQDYKKLISNMINKNINETLRLKKSYIRYPFINMKRISVINENIWNYVNIYNHYFCFCKGFDCFNKEISQRAKYFFYQYIIDNNRDIYKKTDYLFIDFIFAELSSDDAYPIFKEMVNKNYPVHYLTEKSEIYNEFCFKKNKCLTVIPVSKKNFTINGDFLENYLTLFLKLKQVISGSGTYFNYINNIFYNIEYITYISITHGVCFFKYFLYEDYYCYGHKRIDKILIPPLDIIISLAKNYGWKDEDIIKINLPRWDKYKAIDNSSFSHNHEKYENKYILLLFTWRDINKNKNISYYYLKNIYQLIINDLLLKALKKKNIILYYTFHHKIKNYNYRNISKEKNFIKFINEKDISEYLKQTSLVITDFSSIIFDVMYRKKPFIIYVPDANDPLIKINYKKNYYELIQSLKNGTIEFYNKFFELNETINKIIYYINNDFHLEQKLKIFYDKLGFKYENNINNVNLFIEYLSHLN